MSRQVDIRAIVSHIVRGDGQDKCRICMGDTTEGQVYLGDTVMVDGERAVTLSELLETITGVEILEDPLCPPGACVVCTNALLAANDFRTLVRKSQSSWTKAVHSLNYSIPSTTTGKSLYAFIDEDNLKVQLIHNSATDNPATILQKLTKTDKKLEKKPRQARAGPSCDCPDCGQKFLSPYYLNVHFKNSGQKDACTICGLVTSRGRQMQIHLYEVHKQQSDLCPHCPALFDKPAELDNHLKSAHKTGGFNCDDCGRHFSRSRAFELHSQMHAVRTCRTCEKQFTNRACYRKHRSFCEPNAKPDKEFMPRRARSNVRDPAVYICDYCNKKYTSRPQLKNHIVWIHMDIRPHQCQWCGKRFYTPARLAEHTVVHTRVRNFECDICGAKLVSKMAAVYHRRRHTGEKPYQCEDCNEKFISASRRLEHAKRRHGKGVRLQCKECSATFVRGHELKKHMERVHSLDPKADKSVPIPIERVFCMVPKADTSVCIPIESPLFSEVENFG